MHSIVQCQTVFAVWATRSKSVLNLVSELPQCCLLDVHGRRTARLSHPNEAVIVQFVLDCALSYEVDRDRGTNTRTIITMSLAYPEPTSF